jgi:hypothetical protein
MPEATKHSAERHSARWLRARTLFIPRELAFKLGTGVPELKRHLGQRNRRIRRLRRPNIAFS